jgi:hypothetical protein
MRIDLAMGTAGCVFPSEEAEGLRGFGPAGPFFLRQETEQSRAERQVTRALQLACG